MNAAAQADLDLLTRKGLPEELLVLARRLPREGWTAHDNIGGMAGFWLERHAMLRGMGVALIGTIADFREGRSDPVGFSRAFVLRLRAFLGNLDGHHRIEDEHYFPLFARAEPRLARGFDILDGDHHAIHEAIELNAEAGNAFLRTLSGSIDQQRFAADRYAQANDRLVAMLARHLDDEEDLIIPLILEQGERPLHP